MASRFTTARAGELHATAQAAVGDQYRSLAGADILGICMCLCMCFLGSLGFLPRFQTDLIPTAVIARQRAFAWLGCPAEAQNFGLNRLTQVMIGDLSELIQHRQFHRVTIRDADNDRRAVRPGRDKFRNKVCCMTMTCAADTTTAKHS
jgi:hypothetical protein